MAQKKARKPDKIVYAENSDERHNEKHLTGKGISMDIVSMESNGVPISKMYLKLALPLVFSMVISLVYNIADTWFIAATDNTNLIAGVSLGAPVFTLLMAFGNIYGQGGSSLISRLIGRGKTKEVSCVSAVCFYLAIVSGIVVAVIMLLFQNQILRLIGADEETFAFARQYYIWLAAGAPFIITSFIHTNLLRAEGMSKESMIGTVGGAVVNIVLDPIFIFTFGLGAAGAAIASVLGYVFTDVYCAVIVCRKSHVLSVKPADIIISGEHIRQIFGIGVPAALTNIMQSLSIVFVNQFLLSYGNDKIAAMGIAQKVTLIALLILTGFSFGGQPLFGYYFGSKNQKKFDELVRFCVRFICGMALALTTVLAIAAPFLIRLFLTDSSLQETGTLMLRLQVISMVFVAVVLLLTIVFQSTGKMKETFLLSISRQGVVFLAVLLVASYVGKYYGIISSQAIADVISAILALMLFAAWKRSEPFRNEEKM